MKPYSVRNLGQGAVWHIPAAAEVQDVAGRQQQAAGAGQQHLAELRQGRRPEDGRGDEHRHPRQTEPEHGAAPVLTAAEVERERAGRQDQHQQPALGVGDPLPDELLATDPTARRAGTS